MEIVAGDVTIADVAEFVERLREIGRRHDCLVQAVDARYVAGREHLERALALADRARERGEMVAADPAMEVLLHVAGTRQIDRALELGVGVGDMTLAIVIDGEDEAAAAAAVRSLVDPLPRLPAPDEERLMSWFEIGPAERAATAASLTDLVLERVALLTVEK